ncbi:MAG: N-acetylmuramoyl-L-alanine amidase [Owenweeksia sp.]|nr:N-acetylmuramoyl-L-alanine amidase [Owenweeksia sp.]
MQENSVIKLEENYQETYEGFDPNDPQSYIAFSLYQDAFIHQSISIAQKVQDQFRKRVNRRDRGVKQQPLMVTKMATMPSVLVELAF